MRNNKINNTKDILQTFEELQIIFVENVCFKGMVGLNTAIYINKNIFTMNNTMVKFSECSEAKLVGLLYHEFSHLLDRIFQNNYAYLSNDNSIYIQKNTTNSKIDSNFKLKLNKIKNLEGGLFIEEFLWGRFDIDYSHYKHAK